MVTFFVEHKGSNSPLGIGTIASLATNTDRSTTPAILILSTGDRASRHRHGRVSDGRVEVEVTEVVDEGNNQPMVFLISLPG